MRKYKWLIEKHIVPGLGQIELRKLRSDHLKELYSRLTQRNSDSDGSLSLRSVKHLHVLLKQILQDACIQGKIASNPALAVKHPKPPRVEMKTWSEDEVSRFLKVARTSSYYMCFSLLLGTGVRLGEALALTWRDVDWDNGNIHVRRSLTLGVQGYSFHEPKTIRGNRTIKLAESTLADLKEHWERQQKERRKAGELWDDRDLILTTATGRYLLQHNVRSAFYRLIEKSGVPRIRIHDLRHTHATLLLQKGVNPKVVSERLGHESVTITLDIYSHVIPSMQEDAALKIDSVLARSIPDSHAETAYGQDMGKVL